MTQAMLLDSSQAGISRYPDSQFNAPLASTGSHANDTTNFLIEIDPESSRVFYL